jgi:hypothetical protein
MEGGILINKIHYNVFCYADDLLLTSTTVTGLQRLINHSNDYITSHGLRFNASKTNCQVFGTHKFTKEPIWTLNGNTLNVTNSIKYLGVTLSTKCNGALHIENRISACRRAHYGLQGSGMHKFLQNPKTISHLYRSAIQPILTYGIHTQHLANRDLRALDKCQANIIKSTIGVSKSSHNTALLDSLRITKIVHLRQIQTIGLIRRIFGSYSGARPFYSYLMRQPSTGLETNLVSRALNICDTYGVSLVKCIFSDNYFNMVKLRVTKSFNQGGITDSIITAMNIKCREERHKILTGLLTAKY